MSDVMGEHSSHCDDIACLGCECDPKCDECDSGGVTRDYYAGMTEGRRRERERIIGLLDNKWFRDAREFLLYKNGDKDEQ